MVVVFGGGGGEGTPEGRVTPLEVHPGVGDARQEVERRDGWGKGMDFFKSWERAWG